MSGGSAQPRPDWPFGRAARRYPAAPARSRRSSAGSLRVPRQKTLAIRRSAMGCATRADRGQEPAHRMALPFERPTVFVVSVNRTTLAQLALTLPEHVALQVT